MEPAWQPNREVPLSTKTQSIAQRSPRRNHQGLSGALSTSAQTSFHYAEDYHENQIHICFSTVLFNYIYYSELIGSHRAPSLLFDRHSMPPRRPQHCLLWHFPSAISSITRRTNTSTNISSICSLKGRDKRHFPRPGCIKT